jgi:2-oxoglutarate ferredoxin oxidoreductase subunit gamma
MNKTNIIIAGEGGQGIQTIAKILSTAAHDSGMSVSYMPQFGVEQRGAPSIAFMSIDDKPLRYPKFEKADMAIILQNRAVSSLENYLNPNTKVIFDSSTIAADSLPERIIKKFGLPATKYAIEKFNPKSFNIIVVGMLAKQIGLDKNIVWENVYKTLGKKFKNEEIEKINKEALEFGYEAVLEKDDFSLAIYKTKHKKIIVKGHGKTGEIVPSRCKGCGLCLVKCPVGALKFSETLGVFATPVPEVDLEKCIGCGNCRNYCPDSAISIVKDK